MCIYLNDFAKTCPLGFRLGSHKAVKGRGKGSMSVTYWPLQVARLEFPVPNNVDIDWVAGK